MKRRRLTLHEKAELVMKKAVQKVVERHKREGRPIVVWEKGRVRKKKIK